MPEFIVNPRRAPRAPARCRASVVTPAGAFDAETEDIGSRGCQVVSPKLVRKGDPLTLTISADKVPDLLRAAGKVAWVSPQPPWRVGIAFDDATTGDATRWFDKLILAYPGLGSFRRVPERIPVDAMVYLGPPPRFLVDFTADEARLLRAIGSGAQIDELQARLRGQWPGVQRALFSLIARQAVTLVRGQAAHPDAWKKILTDVEASLAIESLGAEAPTLSAPPPPPAPTPIAAARGHPLATPLPVVRSATPVPARERSGPTPTPVASPWGTSPQDPHPVVELGDDGPPLEVATPTPMPPRGAVRAADPGFGQPRTPTRDFSGAGVGWRQNAGRNRPPEAQEAYDRAVAELTAGNVNGALALLRRALSLSPGDPEIAQAIGRLAFKDRMPGL